MSDKILLAVISIFVALFVGGIIFLFVSSADKDPNAPAAIEEDNSSQNPDETRIISKIPGEGAVPDAGAANRFESGRLDPGKTETIGPETLCGGLSGRVLDTNDTPVQDATISLYKVTPGFPISVHTFTHQSAVTDNKGKYLIESILVDSGYSLFVKAEKFAGAAMNGLSVAPGRTIQVADFRLDAGYSLSGIVTDPAGTAISDVDVVAIDTLKERSGMSPEAYAIRTASGTDGVYMLTCLSQTSYQINFSAPGYRSFSVPMAFILIGDDNKAQELDVQLHPSGLSIKGNVLSMDNRPVKDAKITAFMANTGGKRGHFLLETESGKNGAFVLNGLSEGTYSLRVDAGGYFQKNIETADAGTKDCVIEMAPSGSLEGTLHAPGKLPGSYTVSIDTYTPSVRVSRTNTKKNTRCGPKPDFRINDLLPGQYTFEVSAPGYALTGSEEVEVLSGETTTGLVVELKRGGTIKGVVISSGQNKVKGAEVSLRLDTYLPGLPFEDFIPNTPEQGKIFKTGSKGAFVIEHVRAGKYCIEIKAEKMARNTLKNISVREGETTDLGKIKIRRGGRIKGTAYDENGRPSKGIKVTAISMDAGDRKTATTDNKGCFEMENLTSGEYTVNMTLKDIWSALKYDTSAVVQVYEDQTSHVEIYTRIAERNKKNKN